MTNEEWDTFVEQAQNALIEKNQRYIERYGFTRETTYQWDLQQAELIWLDHGQPVARSPIQYIGSISRSEGTWLWSWANETIPEHAKSAIEQVRAFGNQQGLAALVTVEWQATERDGENMTAVAVHVLEAEGFFRERYPDVSLFFALMGIEPLGEA